MTSIPAGVILHTSGSRIDPLPHTLNSALFSPHLQFTQNLGLSQKIRLSLLAFFYFALCRIIAPSRRAQSRWRAGLFSHAPTALDGLISSPGGGEAFHGGALPVDQDVGVEVQRRLCRAVPQQRAHRLDVDPQLQQPRGKAVPLRYNYDKPEKPRRIKGFEVFSLVFSSFFKPKNHTERSRIIGGVSLTTNE